ncbi:Crp/Fnr family transcriptional regulator [Brevibacillus sp. H7]|uniref:Crp/Fnr family transcriptional regulator n=1 Tax=Brevibacillus sp. H7 TaxID=3349138 RepID=UPI00381C1C15
MVTWLDDKASPWMENLPFSWHSLEPLGQKMMLQKHETVFHQDQSAAYVYVVLHGRIRLFLTSPAGEEKAIAIIGQNGLLGECSLFDPPHYNSSAITASKVMLLKLPIDTFRKKMETEADIANQVLYFLNSKNRILASHTMQLSFYSATQRICYTLLQLGNTYGKTNGEKRTISVRFTHQELANVVGTSRVTVANTMKWLERKKVLSKQNGLYVIEDAAQLHGFVFEGVPSFD